MKRDEFVRNLAAGTYDLIVMDVLHRGPNYGYGIGKLIFERSKGTIRWHEGTLYPVLHRLEKRGLLASETKFPKRGHERRYYRLTTRGQRVWREQRDQWTGFQRDINLLLGSVTR
jgi:DNA-binding PadR family transcriptional regulator